MCATMTRSRAARSRGAPTSTRLLRILGGRVTLNPWLPGDWDGIRFRLRWRGRLIRVAIDREHVELLLGGPAGGEEEVQVGGHIVPLTAGEPVRLPWKAPTVQAGVSSEAPLVSG